MSFFKSGWWVVLIMMLSGVKCNKQKSVKLIFGGDVTFSGIVKYLVKEGKCTYNESFKLLKPYLKGADFVVLNLETVIRSNAGEWLKAPPDKDIHLTSEASSILALKYAGVSAVTLANNHANDLGADGLIRTMQLLQNHSIGYFGITYGKKLDARQVPLILEKNGIRVGVLGYCEGRLMVERLNHDDVGAAPLNIRTIIEDVEDLREKENVDVVVLFMHWSDEYINVVGIELFTYIKQLVESVSIDVIVGSHPHVTQQHFYIGKTLIASSLGNLLFPSHYSCARNFVFEDRNVTNVPQYEDVWEAQSRLLTNPTSYGRLIKVTVNRNGVIPSRTKYLETQVLPSKDKPCLMVDRKAGTPSWRKICGKNDTECMATKDCNAIWCLGTLSYPDLIPPYSTKDGR